MDVKHHKLNPGQIEDRHTYAQVKIVSETLPGADQLLLDQESPGKVHTYIRIEYMWQKWHHREREKYSIICSERTVNQKEQEIKPQPYNKYKN